jgi:HK97 family phage major capsid protein
MVAICGTRIICVRSSLAFKQRHPCDRHTSNVEATSYDVLIDHTEMGAGWATENERQPKPAHRRLNVSRLGCTSCPHRQKASQRLPDDSAFNIDEWLSWPYADKFARSEVAVNGNGVDKPRVDGATGRQ